jgi:signal transduction histidine kinase
LIGFMLVARPMAFNALDWLNQWTAAEDVAAAVLLILTLVALVWQFFRRKSGNVARQQIRWLIWGVLIGGLGFIFYILPGAVGWGQLTPNIMGLIVLVFPISVAVAIVRHNLFDIDTILNRTLVYGALTFGVITMYVLVVGGVSVGFQTNSNLAGLILATILVAMAFRPLHTRLQVGVDRLMYGAGAQPSMISSAKTASDDQRNKTAIERPNTISRAFLSGRWLNLARVIWLILAVLAVGLWSLGSYVDAREPLPSCLEIRCDPLDLSEQDLAVMQALNLPVDLFTTGWTASNIAFGLVFFVLTGLIFWRKSDDWMGLLVSFSLIFLGAIFFTESDDAVWRAYPALRPVLAVVQTVGFAALLLLFFYFPDGQFIPRWRPAQIVVGLSILVSAPFIVSATRATVWEISLILAMVCFGLAAQFYRYRRVSGPLQRQQTRWVILGLVTSFLVMFIWTFAAAYFPPNQPNPERVYFLLFSRPVVGLLIVFFPLTIAFSVLRYRLWNIDLVINRALVYGALTAAIVALYVLLVGGFGALFQSSGNLLVALLATGVAALLFQPLRERLQRGVNRLMYGERDNPVTVLTQMGQRFESTIAPEAALPTLVETVAQTLKLPYAAVKLRSGDNVVAAYGLPVDEPLQLPLVYQTETIGYLLVAPRSPGESFTPADMKLLETIAYQAGTAVHAVQLTADLQRSRQQLITAREEERRRLRRDLHDGLGPHLASQMLTIDAIGKLLKQDPAQAASLLQDLKHQSQTAITDIRRLVYDLRPPALDDLGLVEALREGTRHYRQSGLRINIDAPERLPPLPAAVEVAAYRIAQEALTNVVRHAQAGTCHIRLSFNDYGLGRGLLLQVQDDGRGLPPDHRAGVGCQAMRERATELGGYFVIETQKSGGTQVSAWLPLIEEDA